MNEIKSLIPRSERVAHHLFLCISHENKWARFR